MQSLSQYQCLRRRLQKSHLTVREIMTGQPIGVSALISSYCTEKQDLERPNLGRQARQEGYLERHALSPQGFQNATNASAPSTIKGVDTGEGISTQASTIGLDALNSTAYTLNSATVLPGSFTGINVRQILNSANEDSAVYVVELGDDDNDINPQRWGRTFKIWATYANLALSIC